MASQAMLVSGFFLRPAHGDGAYSSQLDGTPLSWMALLSAGRHSSQHMMTRKALLSVGWHSSQHMMTRMALFSVG
eukprot:8780516-Pyramimonas_sp.AAC.2